jgi:DNA-directed RNA polymerase III subunit RPC2
VLRGSVGDGSAFGGDPVGQLGEELVAHGYHYHGKDYLTSGITGEPLESYVFFGPVYYQKLKHMVYQKLQARGTGPKSMVTHQPTGGKSRLGGLRLGEMERDCLLAYGAASLMQERFMISSDLYEAQVCRQCGELAGWVNKKQVCHLCETDQHIVAVKMPYAFKLLLQEMTAMGIRPTLTVSQSDE